MRGPHFGTGLSRVGMGLAAAALLVVVCLGAWAGPANRPAAVGPDGVFRWQDDGSEVAVFGVNYCVPFTIEYAALGHLGLDRRQVIERDLLHLQRLGLTCLRTPVWDREISDRRGNLSESEPLALLDHLLAEGKRRGLYAVVTPIVWYPTDNASPGFSTAFTMQQLTAEPGEPRAAQRRYLAQFAQHRNPETGLTYADDPAILAFELINEPLYPDGTTDAQVTEYINALTAAIRETGCRKPIFYNGWCGREQAVAASRAEGMTFGWYPTGLVSGGMITTNCLPVVADNPELRDARLPGKAKGLYEFDAADVPWGYMYPAMARTLRAGGAQFANQFQYDSWALASSNCCWQTHFVSLPYAPGKAVSLMIAGEAFRRLPRGASAPPAGDRFGGFRVSFAERLSEMVTETEFLYSNDTRTRPPASGRLERVVGIGRSPVASYEGAGAYFLDRAAPGLWRLEVYPDVVWTADPFARHSVEDETARVIWAERKLTLHLPDLGTRFTAQPVDPGNRYQPKVDEGAVTVRPGVYRLRREGAEAAPVSAEYFAPPPVSGPARVSHQPPDAAVAGEDLTLEATATTDDGRLTLCYREGGLWRRLPLRRVRPYEFVVTLPGAALRPAALDYALALEQDGRRLLFPGARPEWPGEGDHRGPEVLFEASGLREAPPARVLNNPGASAEAALVNGTLRLTSTPLDAARDAVVEVRVPLAPLRAAAAQAVRITAKGVQPGTTRAQITLVQDDGKAYATNLALASDFAATDVALEEWWPCWGTAAGRLDLGRVKELSVAYGTWLFKAGVAQPHGLELKSLALVAAPELWHVPVQPLGPPVALLAPRSLAARHPQPQLLRLMVVPGPEGAEALEMAQPGFGPPPDCAVVNWTLPAPTPAREKALASCDVLRIALRGRTPAVTAVEVGLTEEDGAPWGTDLPVTSEWKTVEVPLTDLHFYGHWAHPAGRGGTGDRLHPERVRKCTVAIGAWLNPAHAGEPHTLQVAALELACRHPRDDG